MAGNTNKTTLGGGDADAFIAAVDDEQRREDARLVAALMREATGEPAVLREIIVRSYHAAADT